MFTTAETFYAPQLGAAEGSVAERVVRRFWPQSVPFALPLAEASASVPAEVNYGRWIVRCPDPGCGGAQVASETDRRFLCLGCLNAAFDGRWLAVEWPGDQDRAEIEALLARRPPGNRSWRPPEGVQDLMDENAAHGLA